MALQGCFDYTCWEVFDSSDLNEQAEVVSDYVNFWVYCVIPSKRMYANTKPWITTDIKNLLIKKESAFRSKDRHTGTQIQKEIKMKINQGKRSYKNKVEQLLADKKSREA